MTLVASDLQIISRFNECKPVQNLRGMFIEQDGNFITIKQGEYIFERCIIAWSQKNYEDHLWAI